MRVLGSMEFRFICGGGGCFGPKRSSMAVAGCAEDTMVTVVKVTDGARCC